MVGIVGGLGAVLFRALIALCHNLFFFGRLSITYDANVHTAASPWGMGVVLVPVLGAAAVAFLVKNFAPEAKGHGVPEVMDAIYHAKGVIRPVVALVKSLASAISIGSGGSIGREGPIIQIGSSFGSTVAQTLGISIWQRITLIAAGASAGIAATFNTPVGGVLFAMEILLHEVSARTLVPVAIATATGTYVGRLFFGATPSFVIPQLQKTYFHLTTPWVLIAYIGLGVLTGLVSVLYIKSIYGFEDMFEHRIKGGYYVRHMLGMLIVGLIMVLMQHIYGHYYVQGVGYATVQDVLNGSLAYLPLLLMLFGLKLLATSLTLGSGASGGVFSPGLFMGVTLGGAYGIAVGWIFPSLDISPTAFAVAGMAGIIGGSTGAAMAAIVMIFEMTRDYTVIIPMTITVALSYGIRKRLTAQSIYTLKLVRRGRYLPSNFMSDFHLVQRARDIMASEVHLLPASKAIDDNLRSQSADGTTRYVVVDESEAVVGTLAADRLLRDLVQNGGRGLAGEMADRNFIAVPPEAKLIDILHTLHAHGASSVIVTESPQDLSIHGVVGVIDKERIVEALEGSLEMFSE